MTLPELRNGISQLLARADSPGAMDLLQQFADQQGRKDVTNAVVALRGRYGRVRTENARGVLSQADLDLGMNKINNSIVDLVDQLETQPKPGGATWLRVVIFAGVLALVAGFLLFKYLPKDQSPLVSVPQQVKPLDQGSHDVNQVVGPNNSSSTDLKNDNHAEGEKPPSGVSSGEVSASPATPPTSGHTGHGNTTNPLPVTSPPAPQFYTLTLQIDAPWHHGKVFVDGVEFPLETDLDYTKIIRLKAGSHLISLRMSDGKTCEKTQLVSKDATLYFTCSY